MDIKSLVQFTMFHRNKILSFFLAIGLCIFCINFFSQGKFNQNVKVLTRFFPLPDLNVKDNVFYPEVEKAYRKKFNLIEIPTEAIDEECTLGTAHPISLIFLFIIIINLIN